MVLWLYKVKQNCVEETDHAAVTAQAGVNLKAAVENFSVMREKNAGCLCRLVLLI